MTNKPLIILFVCLTCLTCLTCLMKTASAATSHTIENVIFEFYDASGDKTVSSEPIFGDLDLVSETGRLYNTQSPAGNFWLTDITHINQWSGVSGSGDVENHFFEWATETWFIGTSAVTCNISLNLNSCEDERNSSGIFISSEINFYEHSLKEGQLSLGSFLDWGTFHDIPILTVLEVTNTGSNGVMTFVTVDSDNDGVPGSAMLNCSGCGPFPGQTPTFSGTLVLVRLSHYLHLFGCLPQV